VMRSDIFNNSPAIGAGGSCTQVTVTDDKWQEQPFPVARLSPLEIDLDARS
jgi:hypothetical protein